MEFEQYLEKDIIRFLDGKIEKKENVVIDREEEYGMYMAKDYLKELSFALDNDELTKAKRLFDELKTQYSLYQKNSIERKKTYIILEKMYDKIQNYVKIKEGKIEVIRQGDSEVQKDNTEKFEDIATRISSNKINTASNDEEYKEAYSSGLPIHIGEDKNSKKDSKIKDENNSEEHKVSDASVESNILNKQNKGYSINSDTANNDNQASEDISYQNVFVKTKSRDTKEKDTSGLPQKIIIENGEIREIRKHGKDVELNQWKEEIIDRTKEHLGRLKMHVTDRLLHELRKKIEEKNNEQERKIEELRKEMIKQINKELDKRFDAEKYEVSNKMENLRGEILDQVYRKARHIISSKDNQDDIVVEHYHIESPTPDLPSVERSDVVRMVEEKNSFGNFDDNNNISQNKYSGEELRVVYEQAIYHMFNNKYDEAAKLFRKIINVQPTNKAARIRLEECMERQPELYDSLNTEELVNDDNTYSTSDSSIDSILQGQKMTDSDNNAEQDSIDIDSVNKSIDTFGDAIIQDLDKFTDNINDLKKQNLKHRYNDEEINRMYAEAIYTMFQNNYSEAAKIFEQILRIRPGNKAAKIRLHECIEAIGNA